MPLKSIRFYFQRQMDLLGIPSFVLRYHTEIGRPGDCTSSSYCYLPQHACLNKNEMQLNIGNETSHSTGLQQKRVYSSLGSSCPQCVHQNGY